MQARLEYSAANCSVAAALAVVGEKWTLLVLREAFFGLRRFEDMHQALGCARNILSDRLATLVDHGLLERCAYQQEGQRQRFEYRLTQKGVELFPTIVALMTWGDRWLARGGQPPVEILHRDCSSPVHLELRCADPTHGPLKPEETLARPGMGALKATAA
jgi:DNA-binding HxlR family transcriptional regulator